MTDTPDRQAIALFRYGLIADLIHLPAGSRGLYARLREKAAADYSNPGSKRMRVAPETLRRCLKAWRRGGFGALLPKGRADQGRSRVLPQAAADALMSLKEERTDLPKRTGVQPAEPPGSSFDRGRLLARWIRANSAGELADRRIRQRSAGLFNRRSFVDSAWICVQPPCLRPKPSHAGRASLKEWMRPAMLRPWKALHSPNSEVLREASAAA
jgi:hypothetical protein